MRDRGGFSSGDDIVSVGEEGSEAESFKCPSASSVLDCKSLVIVSSSLSSSPLSSKSTRGELGDTPFTIVSVSVGVSFPASTLVCDMLEAK